MVSEKSTDPKSGSQVEIFPSSLVVTSFDNGQNNIKTECPGHSDFDGRPLEP